MSENSFRKTNAVLRVTDSENRPLAGAQIRCRLVNHKFLFGCGVFDAVPFVNGIGPGDGNKIPAEDIDKKQAELADRMQKWTDLFNYGTLPFYWGGFEREEGKPKTEALRKTAEYLKSKDVTMKGHTLCWQTVCAGWLLKYDTDTILNKQIDRVRREVSDFAGLVDIWDVVNEAVIMPVYDKYDNAATRMCKVMGRVKLIKTLFDEAHQANPNAVLLLNDFNLSQSYEILIDGCLNAGVPIHTIGIQSHQHQGIWGREKTEKILERFEHFGLPIHFTENTIVAGPLVAPEIDDLQDAHYSDDDTSPEYEQMQAEELEKMYRLLFEEHPLVEAITNWDFSDGAWLNAPSGFIRKDGSLKPSYKMLKRLINEEWTTDVTVTADENGIVSFSGYKGKYEISCGEMKVECQLDEEQEERCVCFPAH